MTRQMTKRERQEFLAEQHIGVLSVACDGSRPPLSFPVWYGYRLGFAEEAR
jgi:nitroimidazol reductase NimA-like FMN-containing flavoprotein (pyridoxamine 5'-phosphate oxidase superfamily)